MISLKKREQGFTIVELLIVIVVIGILAALVITTYSGIQAKARDGQRQTDVQSLQTHIEAYFADNGSYPTLANLNDATWRATNMKSLDTGALVDPQSTCDPDTTSGGCLVATPAAKSYAYAATCDTTGCSSYTLTATLEKGGTYVKKSLD